jgi:hypothetical protein
MGLAELNRRARPRRVVSHASVPAPVNSKSTLTRRGALLVVEEPQGRQCFLFNCLSEPWMNSSHCVFAPV